MQPLSERASKRCESNILRYVPSHKQAWIWSHGTTDEKAKLQGWIDANKAHLGELRASIADGVETCIDSGWPVLGEKPPTQTVTQPVAETPASDPVPEPDPLSDKLAALEVAKARIDDRSEPEAEPDTPPEAIADLFQTDRPYAEQAAALWVVYNELTNKIMMKLATDADRTKHSRLQGELDWIKRHAFEAV